MIVTGNIHAVLTSDQSRDAMGELKSGASAFGTVFPCPISGAMDTFRHDRWQLLRHNPVFAFRAALFLRCVLKMKSGAGIKFDTRISIGIGPVDFVAENRISDSGGLAFDGSFAEPEDRHVEKRRLPDHCIPDIRKPGSQQTAQESFPACFSGLVLIDE